MATIITINATDAISDSRTDINTNFANLNSDKMETSVIDTDTALTANSDSKVPSQKAVKAYVDALGGITGLVPTGAILPYGGSSAPTEFLLCDGTAVSRSTYATLFGVISTTYGVGDGSNTFNLPDLRSRFPLGSGTGTKVLTFASRSSNIITVTGSANSSTNEVQTGQAVLYTAASGAMTGLTTNTTYYIIRSAYNQFSLATSLANAIAGTAISLSSDGSGTQTFTFTLSTRTRGDTGGEETHGLTVAELAAHTHNIPNSLDGGGTPFTSGSGDNLEVNYPTSSTGGSTAHNNMPSFLTVNYIIKI